uniref:Fucosyltransferase n=2 Tax=Meloidogyne TaxID=189290 RepID=A0A6V7U422_MELEN|nr:unnamed protein product [Meloidogyne enterolobii]CAD2202315.1 unnamed protein product [Meloidogyne enterolobii]
MMRYRNFFTSFRGRLLLPLILINIFIFITFFYSFFSSRPQQLVEHQNIELYSQPVRLKKPTSKPLILMWTNIFRLQTMQLESDCPLASLCELTYNRSLLPKSSAVVFHIPDINWNYSRGVPTVPDLPYQSANGQRVNVFLSHENPTILRTMYMSGALSRHVHNFFHWAMTYVNTSHVSMPYGGFWLPPAETTRLGFKPIQLPSDQNTILHNKTQRGILWLVSNCNSNSKREVAVEALSKYINIKIGGKCGKTPEDRNLCPRNRDCSYLYSNYYFYIAMENDICNNYVTEKFWERYTFPSVPIVLKASIYQGFIPDNSFIALDQFKTPKQMAEHLNWLMDNPIQYLKYFEWRSKGWSIAWNHEGFRLGPCALCERLLRLSNGSEPFPSPIPNAVRWFEENSNCEGGDFAVQWSQQK